MEMEYRGAPKEAFEGKTPIYLENVSLFSDNPHYQGNALVKVETPEGVTYTRAVHSGDTLEKVVEGFEQQFPDTQFYYVTKE